MLPYILLVTAFGLVLVVTAFRSLYRAYTAPLRHLPGPFLARFTRLWLLKSIYSRNWHNINIELHRKYGPVVRVAPNQYSIDDPGAAQVIYRSRDQLAKSPSYQAFDIPHLEQGLFATLDNDHNTRRRRQVLPLYQTGAVANIEYHVDNTIDMFLAKMEGFARTGAVIDIARWLHFYSYDSTGALTVGKPFGFVEQGKDIADVISTLHGASRYGANVGVFSEWHSAIYRILQLITPKGDFGFAHIHNFALKAMADLKQRSENEKPTIEEKSHGGDALESDYLASFLAKAKRTPDTFTEYDAYYHIMSNILAGGEATGISLSAATYYLCNNPQALAKLRQEMKDLKARSQNRIIGTKEASECPYLQAVIKEAIRLFPAPGLGVNRVVPEGGLEVAGWTFPEGTLIGTNPWVAGVNPVAFGPDPTNFRPERWLESPQSASKLNDYFFGFGRGPRACIGKGIAMLEMNKLIPELVLRFDIRMADPGHDWTIFDDGFVKPHDFLVKVVERRENE